MNELNLGPVMYDNSRLLSLLPILHDCAKRERDRTDKDILKGAPNDALRDAMFGQYAAMVDSLEHVLHGILHFQIGVERMADEQRGEEAVREILATLNASKQ